MGTQDLPIDLLEETIADAAVKSIGEQSLALVQTTLATFDAVEAGLNDLKAKYQNVVFAVSTTDGMADAKAARIAIREPRYGIDKAAKAAKAPLNALKSDIDARAATITNVLVELETPIHEQIKAEEDRAAAEKERVKAEKLAAAAKAQSLIDSIRNMAVTAAVATAADISAMRAELDTSVIDTDLCGDRTGEALQVKMQTLATLDTLHTSAVQREAVAAQAAADRAELDAMREAQRQREERAAAQQREEAAAAQAVRDAENKKLTDDLAAQRAAFAEEQRLALAKQEAAAREIKEQQRLIDEARLAEQQRIDAARAAEQKRIDDAAAAAKVEQERVAKEQAAAEQKRLDDEAAARRAAADAEAARQRAADEAAHIADQRGRAAWRGLIDALQALVAEAQPLGIERPAYQAALRALSQAEGA